MRSNKPWVRERVVTKIRVTKVTDKSRYVASTSVNNTDKVVAIVSNKDSGATDGDAKRRKKRRRATESVGRAGSCAAKAAATRERRNSACRECHNANEVITSVSNIDNAAC